MMGLCDGLCDSIWDLQTCSGYVEGSTGAALINETSCPLFPPSFREDGLLSCGQLTRAGQMWPSFF